MLPLNEIPGLANLTGPEAYRGRSLSGVLLRYTFAITLGLGLLAAAMTMWVDLQREKTAVERLARDFMASALPSAAAAAYNFDQAAAEQVAKGLFLERSITAITILNEGEVMVDETRTVQPTLPQIGTLGSSDEVVLNQMLFEPDAIAGDAPIGMLSITVDKSLVSPEIVDRLLTFFLITTAKNTLFGLLLFWMVFNVLARHISTLSRLVQDWQPGTDMANLPETPRVLRDTELHGLGERIEQLTELANGALTVIQRSHDAVLDNNAELSDAVRDRTRELERVNTRLRHMAERDGLTGLYNRAHFDRALAAAFDEHSTSGHTMFVLLVDVDHFKAFNDFYGHQAGDSALVALADILRRVQDETGCMVARYGGEEFVAFLQSETATPATVARQMHRALEQAPIEHQHSTVARRLTVSIGTATTEEIGAFTDCEMLISAADDALYEAKNLGRNQTVASTPEIRAQARAQRLSVQALLEAIEAREFEPFLQPQIDARSGELVGAEALVRWLRADGSVVTPDKFMKTAVRTGLIKKIDAIMLEKLGTFLQEHPNALPRLSFNVPGENFENPEYVDELVSLAAKNTTGLTVELLETAFIDRPDDRFLWHLDRLREAGIEIEIDDFGTGRTSILGLMAISPSRLKIARELIFPMGHRDEQIKLVTSVVDIARSLDMNVLAEGVETPETAQLLIDLGCPVQQGYFHGRPMPMQELVEQYCSAAPTMRQLP